MKRFFKEALNRSVFENTWDVIRVFLGIALFLKGIHFLVKPNDLGYWISQGQLTVFYALISQYVISAHLVGGLLLSMGLLTRVATYIQIPVLTGALVMIHSQEELFSLNQNIELTTLVLVLLVMIAIIGPGSMSLDYHMLEQTNQSHTTWIRKIICVIFNLQPNNDHVPKKAARKKS